MLLFAFWKACNDPNRRDLIIDPNEAIKDSIRILKQELAGEKIFSDSLRNDIVVFESKIATKDRSMNIIKNKYEKMKLSVRKLSVIGSVSLLSKNIGADSLIPIHVLGVDTFCDITIDQSKIINSHYIDKYECFEIRDSLHSIVDDYKALVSKKDILITSMDGEIEIQDTIIGKYGRVVVNDSIMLVKKDKSLKVLKFQRNGCALLLVISCLLLVF